MLLEVPRPTDEVPLTPDKQRPHTPEKPPLTLPRLESKSRPQPQRSSSYRGGGSRSSSKSTVRSSSPRPTSPAPQKRSASKVEALPNVSDDPLSVLGSAPSIKGEKKKRFVQDLFRVYSEDRDVRGQPLMSARCFHEFLESITSGVGDELVHHAGPVFSKWMGEQREAHLRYGLMADEDCGRGLCLESFCSALEDLEQTMPSGFVDKLLSARYSLCCGDAGLLLRATRSLTSDNNHVTPCPSIAWKF